MRNRLFILLLLASCSVQKKNGAGNGDLGPNDVSPTGDVSLQLFSRGPNLAGGSSSIDSRDASSINNFPRNSVFLYDLKSKTSGLNGTYVEVYNKESDLTATNYNTFKNSKVNFNTKEFRAFMVYGHASKAYRYMKTLFPSMDFKINGQSMLPFYALASEPGSALNTRYNLRETDDGEKLGVLMFYTENRAGVPYNPADESDAIYHEVAHSMQHILNPAVLENAGFYDTDLLLEALADFFAASVARDDNILRYLKSNAPLVFPSNNSNGVQHDRSLGGNLKYPDSYTGDYHLDARVVSNALNDIRKFLQGQSVTLLQGCGSSCSAQWSVSTPLALDAAFDRANLLANEALRELVPQSTLIQFAEKLIAKVDGLSWTGTCGTSSSCKTDLKNSLRKIFVSRGILNSRPLQTQSLTFGQSGTQVIKSDSLRFLELGKPSYANEDGDVDSCEGLIVYPNISVPSTTNASLYDVRFKLVAVTNFSSFLNIDDLSQSNSVWAYKGQDPHSYDTDDNNNLLNYWKAWGLVLPGESSQSLVGSLSTSRYYKDHQLSHLSPKTFSTNRPPVLGWAVRSSSGASTTASVLFHTLFRPYESEYAYPTRYTYDTSVQQSLNVSASPQNFCN